MQGRGFDRIVNIHAYDGEGSYLGSCALDSDYVGADNIRDIQNKEEFNALTSKVAPKEIDNVKKDIDYTFKGRILRLTDYGSTRTDALYDHESDQWFNRLGQSLRSPEDYNSSGVDW
jgi:hypothetical protein